MLHGVPVGLTTWAFTKEPRNSAIKADLADTAEQLVSAARQAAKVLVDMAVSDGKVEPVPDDGRNFGVVDVHEIQEED